MIYTLGNKHTQLKLC